MILEKTNNYSKFMFYRHNREIHRPHVERLKRSMKEKYLVSPIIVNQNFKIIDGQHRFVACSELALPVYYIKVRDYGEDEIQIYNMNQSNWGLKDWLHMYCSKQYPAYLALKDYMEKNDLPLNVAMVFGNYANPNSKSRNLLFKNGEFTFLSKQAQEYADRYNAVKLYWNFSSSVHFAMALRRMFQNPDFEWERFRDQCDKYWPKVIPCTREAEYVRNFQRLYNFNKINRVKFEQEKI